jgi:hypothetical protein
VGYTLIKDLAPLLLGVLAVLIASWYQQRMAFLAALRACWSHLIEARTSMLVYLTSPTKSEEAYGQAYREISRATDEVRTVYRNVGEDEHHVGWYPYEPVNDMRKAFESVAGDDREEASAAAGEAIWDAWEALRWRFLEEFSAPEPTHPMTVPGERADRRRGPKPNKRRWLRRRR